MKRIFVFFLVIFFVGCVSAQQKTQTYSTNLSDTVALSECDSLPMFPGGEKSLHLYVGQQMSKVCSQGQDGDKASLKIQFIVEKDGGISNVRPVEEDLQYKKVYERLYKIFSCMPQWRPGMKDEKYVRCNVQMPINLNWQSGEAPNCKK